MRVIKVFVLVLIVLTLIVGCSSNVTEEQSKLSKSEIENGLYFIDVATNALYDDLAIKILEVVQSAINSRTLLQIIAQ